MLSDLQNQNMFINSFTHKLALRAIARELQKQAGKNDHCRNQLYKYIE